MLILYILGLVLIFYLLAKICEQYFVSSLDIFAKKLHLSEDVAGATFMAIGSSAPEFFTALIAVLKVGSEQIGSGTIVGSAIFNILVIIGASAVIARTYLTWQPVIRDIVFYLLSIIVLLLTFQDGKITLIETLLYISSYAGYIIVLKYWPRFVSYKERKDKLADVVSAVEKEDEVLEKRHGLFSNVLLFIDKALGASFPDLKKKPSLYPVTFGISILYIIVLSWFLVEIAVLTAHTLGIPEVIIALTILAAGTSIPDLLSSIIVARQGRGDMAVSNAVGSNIFDILICLGIPWFFYISVTGKHMVVATENLISSILLLFFTVIVLLFLLLLRKFRISRRAGFLLLVLYIGYVVYAISLAY